MSDTATKADTKTKTKFPSLWSVIFHNDDYTTMEFVVLVLAMIRAVQIFDEVFVLTGGGPGSATTFIVQFIYQTGFAEQIHLYGLAAAASLVLALGLRVIELDRRPMQRMCWWRLVSNARKHARKSSACWLPQWASRLARMKS